MKEETNEIQQSPEPVLKEEEREKEKFSKANIFIRGTNIVKQTHIYRIILYSTYINDNDEETEAMGHSYHVDRSHSRHQQTEIFSHTHRHTHAPHEETAYMHVQVIRYTLFTESHIKYMCVQKYFYIYRICIFTESAYKYNHHLYMGT